MLKELKGSNVVDTTLTGGRATRIFMCEWDEAPTHMRYLWAQPHPEFTFLRPKGIRLEPMGAPQRGVGGVGRYSHRKIVVEYSFDYRDVPLGEDPRVTVTARSMVLQTGAGRTYSDTGEMIDSVDDQVGITITIPIYTFDCAVATDPTSIITALVDKVNNDTHAGFAAGTLLFQDDFQVIQQYWHETESWYFRLTYSLAYNANGHNRVWRPPIYLPDADGNVPQYYQDQDAAKANYTVDAALVGRPVYKSGASGTGAWTDVDPVYFGEADFSVLPFGGSLWL